MTKSLFYSLILICIFVRAGFCQDLALHKTYTLSALPNYPAGAPPSDRFSLTDGLYTQKGRFWSQKTTLGWQNRPKVEITIDLSQIVPVESVTFNTAGGVAGAYFPKHVFIFISKDGKSYAYAGDATTGDKEYGTYRVHKFVLAGINQQARYVRLVGIPNGHYLFCDEIEVLKGNVTSPVYSYSINKESIGAIVDSLISLDHEWQNLMAMMSRVSERGIVFSQNDRKYIDGLDSVYRDIPLGYSQLSKARNIIGTSFASYLNKKYHSLFIVEKWNPWDTIDQLHEPHQVSNDLTYRYTIPVRDNEYGAFVITNCSKTPISVTNRTAVGKDMIMNLELYDVAYVPAGEGKSVADAITPLLSSVNIEPGFSRMIFFKITGLRVGTDNSEIDVSSGGVENKLNVQASIVNLSLDSGCILNTNVWAYLNYPILRDRQDRAVADLSEHHINTMVIPPTIIPQMDATDFTLFSDYISKLKKLKGLKNLLLFDNYISMRKQNGYSGGQFMSGEWKIKFVKWYDNLVTLTHSGGLPDVHIYFYPYDEIRGDNNIEDFKNLIQWAKTAIPDIKFFASLSHSEAIDNLLPLIDVAQISGRLQMNDSLPQHHADIWTYSSSSRLLSPYSYYRLMAWKAFVKDYTGVGFWNYADEGNGGKLSFLKDPLLNAALSYSVIYDGRDGSIISSRRWEAFSLGIEDYGILCLYGKKFSISLAKALAQQVLAHPEDVNLADEIREKLVEALIR